MSAVSMNWTKHVRSDYPLTVDFSNILEPDLTLASGVTIAVYHDGSASSELAATGAINGSEVVDRSDSSNTVAANKGVVLTWTADGTVGKTYQVEVSATDSAGVVLTITVNVSVVDR